MGLCGALTPSTRFCSGFTARMEMRSGSGLAKRRMRVKPLSVGNEQPTQNWNGQGESDCLIKTKHCDGANAC